MQRWIASAGLLVVMSGCGTPGMMHATTKHIDDAQAASAQLRETGRVPTFKLVEEEPGPWLTAGSTPRVLEDTRPALLNKAARFVSAELIPLPDIVESLSRTHGIPIVLRADVFNRRDKNRADRSASIRGPGSAYGDQIEADSRDTFLGEVPRLALNYTGTVAGMMDAIANRTGLYWRYVDNRIVFSRLQTRTFHMRTMPGTSQFSATVGKSANASEGAGGSARLSFGANSSISMSSSLDYWKELLGTVSGMLSDEGQVSTSSMTNSITVTDLPEVVDRVAEFVDAENAVLGRQVGLRVQVYSVKLTEQSASGIDWSLLYRMDGNNLIGLNGPSGSSVIERSAGGRVGAQVFGGRFASSKFIVQALSAQGRVGTVIDTNVVTLNNQPAPVAVTENRGFISKTSLTPGSLGSASVITMEQDVLTTGFIMNLLPTIMENRSIMLQVQIDLSELKKMERFNANERGSGDLSEGLLPAEKGDKSKKDEGSAASQIASIAIDAPYTSAIQTMQRASLKSGDTLVLSGFRRNIDSTGKQGVISYQGGTKNANQDSEEVVILISPELVEGV